jgi:hypothetical protein
MFVAVAAACAGCGGFSASRSVSPATFFLPGLMQTVPPTTDTTNLLATVR